MLGRIMRLQFLVEENNNRCFSAKNDDDTKLMTSIVTKQMKNCEAGLAHLEQSLCHEDACCEERRRSSCRVSTRKRICCTGMID